MSALTDRLRARADRLAYLSGMRDWSRWKVIAAMAGWVDPYVAVGVEQSRDSASLANLALDLREAADRLDFAESALASWEWIHGVGQPTPPEGVLTVTEGKFCGLPEHHQPKGGAR